MAVNPIEALCTMPFLRISFERRIVSQDGRLSYNPPRTAKELA
jgi:hypothetical protein